MHAAKYEKLRQHTVLPQSDFRSPAMEYLENGTVLSPVHCLDSVGKANITFVTYKDSIEQNLYALIATKEQRKIYIGWSGQKIAA